MFSAPSCVLLRLKQKVFGMNAAAVLVVLPIAAVKTKESFCDILRSCVIPQSHGVTRMQMMFIFMCAPGSA